MILKEIVADEPASLPSSVLLILVPLMPNLFLAVLLLLARFSISQMDVPTRQAYLMAVVEPAETFICRRDHRRGKNRGGGN